MLWPEPITRSLHHWRGLLIRADGEDSKWARALAISTNVFLPLLTA